MITNGINELAKVGSQKRSRRLRNSLKQDKEHEDNQVSHKSVVIHLNASVFYITTSRQASLEEHAFWYKI